MSPDVGVGAAGTTTGRPDPSAPVGPARAGPAAPPGAGPAMPSPGALGRCIAQDADAFARETWSLRPLLSRAAQILGGFTDLLDEAAVDELVSRRGLRTPFLRVAKDGALVPPARFTRGGGTGASIADQVADDKVLDLLVDGATLVLQGLHRVWPPLVHFGTDLATELGHPIQINAYVTPPQNQGFAAHYDTHDVFVLQVAGRKRWRIHEPVFPDPLSEHTWQKRRADVEARALETPVIDTVLEPGDALYLPRGYLHSASALGELSIHLTVGVHPITRRQLLTELLAAAQDDPRLRTSLPMAADLADPAVIAGHLRETAAALVDIAGSVDESTARSVAERVGAVLAAETRPEPLAPLHNATTAGALTAATPLRRRRGLRWTSTFSDGRIALQTLDKTITMPGAVDAALKSALSGSVFTPAELPGLEADEQITVSRRLLREGIVVPADVDVDVDVDVSSLAFDVR